MSKEKTSLETQSQPSCLAAVIIRLFWLTLTPLYLVNIIFGTFMVLPYWIATGTYYYESNYFKGVMAWLCKQHPNGL
jgi:hypothetical protein